MNTSSNPDDNARESALTRREFATRLSGSVLTFGLLQMLWARNLFAEPIKPVIGAWFLDLQGISQELRGQKLKDVEFQAKMEELFRRADLPELLRFVDLSKIENTISLPDNGALSTGFDLSQVEGLPEKVNFGRQIFGMKKDRAIVPHGHQNMCTGFIVLKGNFRGRHYDRLETATDHYIIKPTIDQEFGLGGVSTISDHKDNVHWFRCASETGYIFNAHIGGYDPTNPEAPERLYLDPEGEKLSGGLIKAPKMDSAECHKKFG